METLDVDYETTLGLRLRAAKESLEKMIELDVAVAQSLISKFQADVKRMNVFSPYLPTYYCQSGYTHRIRWGKLCWNESTGKVVGMSPAPANDDGDFLVGRFNVRDKKLKALMTEYEEKFRVLRISIKQSKALTKSLNGRLIAIESGKKKIAIGNVSLSARKIGL